MKSLTSAFVLIILTGCAAADLSIKSGFQKTAVKTIMIQNFVTPPGAHGETFGKMAADIFSKELAKMGFTVVEAGAEALVTGSIAPALQDGRLVVPKLLPPPRPRSSSQKKKPDEEKPAQMTILDISVSVKMERADTGEILWVGRAESEGMSTESSVRRAAQLILKRLERELSLKA